MSQVRKNCVRMSESLLKPEFVYAKNDVTTFECRELVSEDTNGSRDVVLFRALFGPREEHAKHCHTLCDEIVYCISGRGAEGIEDQNGTYSEFEYVAGTTMYLPKGTGHYTRNLDSFQNLELLGIFLGVGNMEKKTTGYISKGPVRDDEKVLR